MTGIIPSLYRSYCRGSGAILGAHRAEIESYVLVVHKYGGTFSPPPTGIKSVARRNHRRTQRGDERRVVVSAMGDTTDDLISLLPGDRQAQRPELECCSSRAEMVASTSWLWR